jgi:seryl-tRNA synthetase
MVQTDVSQLASECKEWRQILRNYRDEFQESRKALPEICRKGLNKDQLQQIEHYDNQFYIQLINIHDLKQFIKAHERKIEIESSSGDNTQEETYTEHEQLLDQFLNLESTLQELRNDFKNFISASSC